MINKVHFKCSFFVNMNFINIVALYANNKKKKSLIDKIYNLKYLESKEKYINLVLKTNKRFHNIELYHNLKNIDNIINVEDKQFLMLHITLLRIISREKSKKWFFVIENNCNNNILNILNSKKTKFPFIQIISSDSKSKTISYIINRLFSKMLIIFYIMFINKIYYRFLEKLDKESISLPPL